MEHYTTITNCRICGSEDLTEVVKFKPQYIGSKFVKSNANHPMAKVKIPMTLMFCNKCHLVQLEETVNPDLLYSDYYYRTSVNDTMKRDLKNVVDETVKRVYEGAAQTVIDIGCNDATMLRMFPEEWNRIGVEPAKNIDWTDALEEGCEIYDDYFSYETVMTNWDYDHMADAITCCACFYDFPDPNEVVQDIKKLL